ncbi:MAG: hypothetical protein RIQ56_923 [Candidatus Parcubacteria bacterium]
MKSNLKETLRYGNYSRKSSVDQERQVLSIDSQIKWAQEEVADRRGIKIAEIYREEKSAKTPYQRPVFNEMVLDIKSGKINSLIEWKLDRLARNPEEAGIIIGMLKRGELKHIITSDREYRPEDNAIISYVDFGMADQYVRDLSKNVRRGLRTKIAAGWRNGVAPLGYLNSKTAEKGENSILLDPDRFELVHRILRMFLEGSYSVRQIQKETEKWGLKTRLTKRQGGKYLTISHIYRILTEPFYAGSFWTTDHDTGERVLVKGAHMAMITVDEFDQIQIKLGRKGKPRPRSSAFFPFTGRIKCGECTSMVTAEEKYQLICTKCNHKFYHKNKDACPKCGMKIEAMENPTIKHYIYYHCTKRKQPECTQRSVDVSEMEKMLDNELSKFELSEAFTQWALGELEHDNEEHIKSQNAIVDSQQRRYKDVVDRLQNLVKLYTSSENASGELLSLEEYTPQRAGLIAEKKALEEAQQRTGRKIEEWVDWAENSFRFSVAARVWFENGSPEQKRDIFQSLTGQNFVLVNKKLSVSLRKPLDLYALIAERYPATTIRLEQGNEQATQAHSLPFAADIPALRRG